MIAYDSEAFGVFLLSLEEVFVMVSKISFKELVMGLLVATMVITH